MPEQTGGESSAWNRREFLLLGAAAAICAGCQGLGVSSGGVARQVDAGPASDFTADTVYEKYKYRGFFLVRRGGKLLALSSVCTHRKCALETEPDHSFSCPCHGSTFSPSGKVTEGPAARDLPALPLSVDARGHVMVTLPAG